MPINLVKSKEIENSSQVKKVGMTDAGDLLVTFTKGTEYIYKAVPDQVYEEMLKAESIGKFLNSNIKGKFEYVQVNKP